MHLATAAGLWTSAPIGTLELFDREASASESIWIPRVFVSGVLTDGLARKVAARVLADAADAKSALIDPQMGIPAAGTVPIRDELVQHYIQLMLKASFELDDARLEYKPFIAAADVDPLRIDSKRQLRDYFSFVNGKVLRIPHWSFIWLKALFSGFLNRNLQGKSGRYVVGDLERLDARDQSLLAARDRAAEVVALAKGKERMVLESTLVHSTPRVWEGIRTLIFGSIDASSDLSDNGFAPIEGKIPVFGRVVDVVADPREVWKPKSARGRQMFPTALEWSTVRKSPEVRDSFVAIIDDATSLIETAAAAAIECEKKIREIGVEESDLRKQLLGSGVLKYNKAGEVYVPKNASTVAAKLEPEDKDEAESGEPTAAAMLERYRQIPNEATGFDRELQEHLDTRMFETERRDETTLELASFDSWTLEHSHSFENQLLDKLQSNRDLASAHTKGFEKQLSAIEVPQAGELVTLRKRFHRVVALWALIPLTIAGLVYWMAWSTNGDDADFRPWNLVIFLAVAWLIIVIAAINMAGSEYYRKWSAFERRVDLITSRVNQAEDGWAGSRREWARLKSLHEQAADWLEILASALHHPWAVNPERHQQSIRTLESTNLPFAMHIANANPYNDGAAHRLERDAAPTLLRKGWREEAFRDLLDEIAREVAVSPLAIGTNALDNDIPYASNNSRSIVRSHMNKPEILERVADRRIANLILAIQQDSMTGGGVDVVPLTTGHFDGLAADTHGVSVDRTGIQWDAHLRETLGTATDAVPPINPLVISSVSVQAGHHEELTSYVLAPERLAAGFDATTGEAVKVIAYDNASSPSLDLVVRIDLAGPIPIAALNLWRGSSGRSSSLLAAGESPTCSTCGRVDCPGAQNRACKFARSGV
ncbi:hypothetical protein [Salinibacterium sp. SWN1162]|uniref:hypothetical protein n=1 Tax=Salinibacterium sp. SWN1162 TaxID=2792053 RepID=UPI0018CED0B3|nr:hypothetical protein [Salinibacterium sp. SWN1162]MBH0008612.1 hypothetical protein [Salinibacterium sp. SWN1162]